MTAQLTRLLGFVPLAGLDALILALEAVPGPTLRVRQSPPGKAAVAVLLQDEPDMRLLKGNQNAQAANLATVQRRMAVACVTGPFLPMDPAAACCSDDAVARLLETAWDALDAVLTRHGGHHQWDIVLQWTPEQVAARTRTVIAAATGGRRRSLTAAVAVALQAERDSLEKALLAALRPVVLAIADRGASRTATETTISVLGSLQSKAVIQATVDALPPEQVAAATIDIRGPLPPVNFTAVRVATVGERDVSNAWQTLDLPDRIDLVILQQQWRLRAAAVPPDRAALADGATVSDMTAAYRLLRDLVPPGRQGETATLTSLLRRVGPRLIVPPERTDWLPRSPGGPDATPMAIEPTPAVSD